MPELVYLPYVGETVTEGIIKAWLKNEGESVQKDEVLCEVTTSKLVEEVSAPQKGILFKIFADVDEKVPAGKVIAVIQLEGEELSEEDMGKINDRYIPNSDIKLEIKDIKQEEKKITEEYVPEIAKQVKISPLAKKVAIELGIDITKIKGTGPNGRITKEDVISYKEKNVKHENNNCQEQEKKIEKLSDVRKIIGNRLRESVMSKPHINFQAEVCMDELLEVRKKINTKLERKISINSFIILATVKAINEFKSINSNLIGDELITYGDTHIGIAVARKEKGLIVPVIKNANKMSLLEIDKESKALAELAREDKLNMDQITGGTFTISNLGMYGIENFNAIINPPEVGILAVSSIIKRPIVINEEIIIANMMNLNVAVDHTVIDGSVASEFVMKIKEYIEAPYLLFV